jgi:hypothetical protein
MAPRASIHVDATTDTPSVPPRRNDTTAQVDERFGTVLAGALLSGTLLSGTLLSGTLLSDTLLSDGVAFNGVAS